MFQCLQVVEEMCGETIDLPFRSARRFDDAAGSKIKPPDRHQVRFAISDAPEACMEGQVGPTKHGNAQIGLNMLETSPRIAVLIPCFNEELTISNVIQSFRAELPDTRIYVFDNNSTDHTVERARENGAVIFHERRQGKGFVVQSMLREIDADIYVMVDGDGTYPAASVHALLHPILNNHADMTVGSRLDPSSRSQFRLINRLGNYFFLFLTRAFFGTRIRDMLSGYRVFSRDIVKQLPLFSPGFEIETELTIKALERGYRVIELPVRLSNRLDGSHSKIRHTHDGLLIVGTIFSLARDYKPLTVFGIIGLLFVASGFIPGTIVTLEFLRTGSISRLPSAVLAVGLILSGLITGMAGLVLHTVVRRFQELDLQIRFLGRDFRDSSDTSRERRK
jgi:glycosyltransferase involved in cell wall biosynthesis